MSDRLRVLIVDDHPGVVRAVRRLLELHYNVVGSLPDANTLLEDAQQLLPDIIVLDMNLPGVDGLTACRQITQEQSHIKVIVFTAMEGPDIRRLAFEAGAAAFVNKVSPSDDLLSTIKSLNGNRD